MGPHEQQITQRARVIKFQQDEVQKIPATLFCASSVLLYTLAGCVLCTGDKILLFAFPGRHQRDFVESPADAGVRGNIICEKVHSARGWNACVDTTQKQVYLPLFDLQLKSI